MSAVIGIVLLIYIMDKLGTNFQLEDFFKVEYEQPPISEFGEIDDKNCGKKLF